MATTTLPIHGEGRFSARDGTGLYERWWLPERVAKATVVLLHGLGEHVGRYERVAHDLNRAGYAVFGYDQRAHGRSDGTRGYVEAFDRLVDDLETFLVHVRERQTPEPVFVLAHSMGGTVATEWAIARSPKIRGLALSSPGLKVADGFSPVVIAIGKLLSKVLPKAPTQKIDARYVSRDPEVVRAYRSDPLVYHGGIRARTGAEILAAMDRLHLRLEEMSLPFFVFHGTEDKLTDCQGSRDLHARSRSTDKGARFYEGLYHETLNEPERDEVVAQLVRWLDAHV